VAISKFKRDRICPYQQQIDQLRSLVSTIGLVFNLRLFNVYSVILSPLPERQQVSTTLHLEDAHTHWLGHELAESVMFSNLLLIVLDCRLGNFDFPAKLFLLSRLLLNLLSYASPHATRSFSEDMLRKR
jgi:hypothetical protein